MDIRKLGEKPFRLNEAELRWVADTIGSMSGKEKCGQLFVLLGDSVNADGLRELVSDWGVGGVLFRPAPAEAVRKKYELANHFARIPLLNAANLEEGGAGVITDGTFFGNALQVAAADDPACTEDFAKCCAAEGKRVGVNWTFSPVADLDLNYRNPITNVRTFGSNMDKVLENLRIFTQVIQKYGVAASCKHYPWDGVDHRDQHLHPTYNSLPAEEWFETYGRIYKTLIDDGLMSIMTGHIVQPNVIKYVNPDAGEEDMLPGSQSREMLTGVLREMYGFNGVIITDATIMGGYTMTMKRSDAIPASINAGADMICFGTDIREDITYLYAALQDGRLSEERLDEAVMRVLALKAAMAREYPAAEIDCTEAQKRCAEKAVTLVKDTQLLVPVSASKYRKVRLVSVGEDDMYDGSISEIAASVLEEQGFEVEKYDPYADDLHGTADLPADRLTLILCNYPAKSNQTTIRIKWCDKHALEIPRFVNEEATAFISFNNPYHLEDIPRVRTYINAYSATAATVTAAIQKLAGAGEFTGVSPVDPFCGLPDTRL